MGALGQRLDLMSLEIFSNLNDSMIPSQAATEWTHAGFKEEKTQHKQSSHPTQPAKSHHSELGVQHSSSTSMDVCPSFHRKALNTLQKQISKRETCCPDIPIKKEQSHSFVPSLKYDFQSSSSPCSFPAAGKPMGIPEVEGSG